MIGFKNNHIEKASCKELLHDLEMNIHKNRINHS
jgi:hypothetical protein